VIDADTHPAVVVGEIIHAIGDGHTAFFVFEVMGTNFFRMTLELPFLSGILEIPD
jgi:hypothetical protein